MAKSPSFFGLRRGSTKSLTFQVLNGRQVTKDRVYDVKNPRTFSQMQQRMVMATAAAAYAGMREIVDHSFEGYTYGQPTMSEFIRLNAKMLREGLLAGTRYLSFNPYGDRSLYPNPYIISKGNLRDFSSNLAVAIQRSGRIGIILNGLSVVEDETTFSDVLSQMGLDKDSIITYVCCAYNTETGYSQFGWCRLIPREDELTTFAFDMPLQDLFDFESNVPVDLNSVISTNEMGMVFDFDQEVDSVSCGIILSKKQLTWRRSNAKMINEFDNEVPSPAATALATYPVGTDYILNGGTVPGGGNTPAPLSPVSGNYLIEVHGGYLLFCLSVEESNNSINVELYGKETSDYLDPITVFDGNLKFSGYEESQNDILNLVNQAIGIIEAKFAGWSGYNNGSTTVDDLAEINSWSYL